jgi:hypothetical protein
MDLNQRGLPYSLTHVLHGFVLCGVFAVLARKASVQQRFLSTLGVEALWEIVENSPFVIELATGSVGTWGRLGCGRTSGCTGAGASEASIFVQCGRAGPVELGVGRQQAKLTWSPTVRELSSALEPKTWPESTALVLDS